MPDISNVRRTVEALTIPFGDAGESISLVYDPSMFNADTERTELEFIRRGERLGAAAYVLSTVLTSWDLTDQGEPYPLTFENCVALGADVTRYLLDALLANEAVQQFVYRPDGPQDAQNGTETPVVATMHRSTRTRGKDVLKDA